MLRVGTPKHEYYTLFGVYSRNFYHAKLDLTGKQAIISLLLNRML